MLRTLTAFLLFPLLISAHTAENRIAELKDTLNVLYRNMSRGENDSVRNTSAKIFQTFIESILQDSTSYSASFDSIKNISTKAAPDNAFRLYTWTYPNNDGSHYYYYGYLQALNGKSKKVSLYTLHDTSDSIEKPLSTKLNAEHWYGAIYYTILKNVKDKKSYYTLLGWHGRNTTLTQKLADVLYFDGSKPVFGYPLFKTGKVYNHRVIFEFIAQATMTLHFDEKEKMLVFDHLSKAGLFKGPDGTYDAFKFTKGHWELINDVDVDAGFKPKKAPKPVPDEELEQKEKEMKK
jgi:hypothetical protein